MSDFPDDLVQAQAALEAARAAYLEYRYALPKWVDGQPAGAGPDGEEVSAVPGWTPEQVAEERRLLEAERQASHAVWAHPYWETLEVGKRVKARTALKHVHDAAA